LGGVERNGGFFGCACRDFGSVVFDGTVFDGAAGGETGGEHEIRAGREGRKVVICEPGDGFQEVSGDGIGVEELDDRFGWEVNFGDFFQDEAGDDFFAEGNEDDVARHKRNLGGIGERAAALAVDFGGDYLVKHINIIALFGVSVGEFGDFQFLCFSVLWLGVI